MSKYSFSLSARSVKRLQRDLKKYQKDLNKKVEELMDCIGKRGIKVVKQNIRIYGAVMDGDLIDSIKYHVEKTDNKNLKVVIEADSSHAIYVEFGTGQVGAEHPYKGNVPVVYAQGSFIRYNAETNRYFWYYFKNGKWHYTEGMPSRPFMLDSATMLRATIIEEEIRKVFKDAK